MRRLAALAILTFAAAATAQTAGTLSFQGVLKNNGAFVNGAVTLQFRLFDASVGGALVDLNGDGSIDDVVGLDAQEVAGVPVTNGVFNANWGPISPKAFDGAQRWLEVTVDGTPLDRVRFATASATAEQLNAPASGQAVATTNDEGNLGVNQPNPQAKLEVLAGPPCPGTGDISQIAGTPEISGGTGVNFLTDLKVGDTIVALGQRRVVTEVVDADTLFVETPFNPEIGTTAFAVDKAVARFESTDGAADVLVTSDGEPWAAGARVISPPIGAIVAWHRDVLGAGTPLDLPDGWTPCNGGVVNDLTSPINGATIPNLNGETRFLRGAATSGTLQDDRTRLPRSTAFSTSTNVHSHGVLVGGNSGPCSNDRAERAGQANGGCGPTTFPTTADAHSHTITSGGDPETRPVNMSVIWIMRIK